MYQEIIKALPVIIGGLLAIMGGLMGQIITHRLATSREKAVLLRQRIESLVRALYGHSQWLSNRHTVMIFKNEDHDAPSPLDEARMLQELYFPELSGEILALMQAQIPMMKFIGEQRIERMKNQDAWINSWNPAPYTEMYKTYATALSAATKKCRELLQTDFKS